MTPGRFLIFYIFFLFTFQNRKKEKEQSYLNDHIKSHHIISMVSGLVFTVFVAKNNKIILFINPF